MIFRLKGLVLNKYLSGRNTGKSAGRHMPGVVFNYTRKSGRHLSLPLLLLFSGCSLSLFPGYHPLTDSRAVFPVSWFQSDSGHFLFNTKIDLMRDHFSGLMVIKPENGKSYRVVFLTEVGLKVFDMEFMPGGQMKVHYIVDAINRKMLINKLSNDLSLVLMNGMSAIQFDILSHKDSKDIIFRYNHGNKRNYYFLNGTNNQPYLARQTAGLANKVRVSFFGNPVTGIDSLKIKHDNFRLNINLYRINENSYVTE